MSSTTESGGMTIYRSPYPDVYIPTDVSYSQFLTRHNPDDVRGDKVIMEDLEEPHDSATYAGFRDGVAKHASWLQSIGLKPGDTVVMYATNSVAWMKAAHAVLWTGGVVAGVNAIVSEFELPHYFSIAKPKFVFTDPDLRPRVEAVLKQQSSQVAVLELASKRGTGFPYNVPDRQPVPSFQLSGDNRKVPGVLLFSSGTSGKPKGVHLSQYNLITHVMVTRSSMYEGAIHTNAEVFYPPLAHMFGMAGVVLPCPFNGTRMVLMRQFEYRKWITACSRIRATLLRSVPAIVVAITKDPEVHAGKVDLKSVQSVLCAGASLQEEVISTLTRLLDGVDIIQGYGMSEAGICGLRPHRSKDKAGSVGRIFAGHMLRLVDDEYRDVPRNTPGQALVKGPSVFMHYKDNKAATDESFTKDGWLCTGDVLAIDDDDFLWFQDRKKEMIKYKGNQVAPAELEDLLNSHPEVNEAGVCASWDQEGQTEIPIAYVVLRPGIPSSEQSTVLQSIRKSIDSRVTPYKRLRGGVHIIDVLPKNPTGKLVRGDLPARKAMTKMLAGQTAKL